MNVYKIISIEGNGIEKDFSGEKGTTRMKIGHDAVFNQTGEIDYYLWNLLGAEVNKSEVLLALPAKGPKMLRLIFDSKKIYGHIEIPKNNKPITTLTFSDLVAQYYDESIFHSGFIHPLLQKRFEEDRDFEHGIHAVVLPFSGQPLSLYLYPRRQLIGSVNMTTHISIDASSSDVI